LEQEILAVLSTVDGPLTAGQVRDALADDRAYTTVLTVLARLHEKGLVQRERHGRAHVYRWVPTGAELTAHQMGRLLAGVADRAAVLARFVRSLSAQDEALLVEMLQRPEMHRPSELLQQPDVLPGADVLPGVDVLPLPGELI
jgi:predicted transcriptional regulator